MMDVRFQIWKCKYFISSVWCSRRFPYANNEVRLPKNVFVFLLVRGDYFSNFCQYQLYTITQWIKYTKIILSVLHLCVEIIQLILISYSITLSLNLLQTMMQPKISKFMSRIWPLTYTRRTNRMIWNIRIGSIEPGFSFFLNLENVYVKILLDRTYALWKYSLAVQLER